MARFNTSSHTQRPVIARATSPLATQTTAPDTRTFQGAPGWTWTPQTELFLRAAGAFHGGESTFYESADKRDTKLRELVAKLAVEEFSWLCEFAQWLRAPGNMRTASLMLAVEAVHARLEAGNSGCVGANVPEPGSGDVVHTNRWLIDAVCQRPDEPGEILAIWTAWFGRRIPKPVKRGVADAARRLYNQRSLLKYDTSSHSFRFGDVLNLTHAQPHGASFDGDDVSPQSALFQYALDRRHNPQTAVVPQQLRIIKANESFYSRVKANPELLCDPAELFGAGMTWEDALSKAGTLGVDKKRVWEAMIPSMNLMALIRNLRNFDEAGVSDEVAESVISKLKDKAVIERSRQFPFRFLSAYRAAGASLRWSYALEKAINLSLSNVPSLGGRTLILVDRSPSMFPEYDASFPASKIKGISRADQAAVFGAALALRAEDPTLVWFGGHSVEVKVPAGGSVLKLVDSMGRSNGTDIPSAVKQHYAAHDRVVILTDEQSRPGWLPSNMHGYYHNGMQPTLINDLVPRDVPVYMWNFAGYSASAMATGQEARFTLGGLTDKAFLLIPQIEAGRKGYWPWEIQS